MNRSRFGTLFLTVCVAFLVVYVGSVVAQSDVYLPFVSNESTSGTLTSLDAANAASDGKIIYACVKSGTGKFVTPDPETNACKDDETQIWWNQQGPQGDPGPKGDQGDPGPAGPKGDQGDRGANWYDANTYYTYQFCEVAPGSDEGCEILCNAGDMALTGGYWIHTDNREIDVGVFASSAIPYWSNYPLGWAVELRYTGSQPTSLGVGVYCVERPITASINKTPEGDMPRFPPPP